MDSVTAELPTIDNKGVSVGGKLYVSTGGLMPIINSLEVLQTVAVVRTQLTTGCNEQLTGTAKRSHCKKQMMMVILIRENSTAKGGKEYTVGLNYTDTVGKGRPRIL